MNLSGDFARPTPPADADRGNSWPTGLEGGGRLPAPGGQQSDRGHKVEGHGGCGQRRPWPPPPGHRLDQATAPRVGQRLPSV